MRGVTLKTCDGFQTFLWLDGALAELADCEAPNDPLKRVPSANTAFGRATTAGSAADSLKLERNER
jgi:hypothetical protein